MTDKFILDFEYIKYLMKNFIWEVKMIKKIASIIIVSLMLVGIVISISNFLPSIKAQDVGCYGISVDDPGEPAGWYCQCQEFVDCWTRNPKKN